MTESTSPGPAPAALEVQGITKRFGALNDVVASRDLLERHRESLPDGASADRALRSLKKEQKRRMKAATKML